MSKFTPESVASGYQSTDTLNANFTQLATLSDTFLSRTGTSPNTMEANLDMNSNRIINLPSAVSSSEPVTYSQLLGLGDVSAFTGTVIEKQIATDGQTTFNLTTIAYTPGVDNICIYRNGVYIDPSQYVETDADTVDFVSEANVGDEYVFVVNQRAVSADTITSSSVTHTPLGGNATNLYTYLTRKKEVNVLDFGAVGNGTTDDTAAIQSAITYVTANGGTLIFPAGYTFALDDTGGQARPAGPGAGPVPTGSTGTKFTITGMDDVTFTGGGTIKLLSNGPCNWHFFQLNQCNRVKIHGLNFIGNRLPDPADINYNAEIGEVFRLSECTDIDIRGNFFTLISITSIRVQASSQRITVVENIAYDGNDCFIQVGDGSSSSLATDPKHVLIANNIIDQFYTDAGIKVRYSAHDVVIDGNVIIAYQGGATQNPPGLMIRGYATRADAVTDIVVSNNRIESIGIYAIMMSDTGFASNAHYPQNVVFSNNVVYGSVGLKGTNILFDGNMVVNGIVDSVLTEDITITNNSITNSAGSASNTINITQAGDYTAVVNNNKIITDGTSHSCAFTNISRLSFCGNVVEKVGTTTSTTNQLELYIPADGQAVINGNTFVQPSNTSYRLGSCIRINGQGANSVCSIVGNAFRNANAYSIRRVGSLSGAGTVTGNSSVGATTAHYLDSTGTYVTAGNTF